MSRVPMVCHLHVSVRVIAADTELARACAPMLAYRCVIVFALISVLALLTVSPFLAFVHVFSCSIGGLPSSRPDSAMSFN